MPDSKTFDNTLEKLAEYVEDIGHDLNEKLDPNILHITIQDQEYSLTGHRCEYSNNRYIVAGHPELRFSSIVYILSLQSNLAADLEPEIARAIVDEEYEDEEDLLHEAAEKLLDDVSRQQMASFESYCYQFISGGTHETSFITNDAESFVAFAISNDIFPYEGSFGIDKFYDAVKPVVSAGERGSRLVGHTVYIDTDDGSPEDAQVELNFNW